VPVYTTRDIYIKAMRLLNSLNVARKSQPILKDMNKQ